MLTIQQERTGSQPLHPRHIVPSLRSSLHWGETKEGTVDSRNERDQQLPSVAANSCDSTTPGGLTESIAKELNECLCAIVINAGTCLRMLSADPPNVEGARETARRTISCTNRAAQAVSHLRALFGETNISKRSLLPGKDL